MTSVNIQKINNTVVVSVAGHADYSNNHNDIVCAAISTITQTLMQTLHYYEEQNVCKMLSEEITDDAGTALFSFISADDVITDALINMAEIGYLSLQKSYPKNIYVSAD